MQDINQEKSVAQNLLETAEKRTEVEEIYASVFYDFFSTNELVKKRGMTFPYKMASL